MEPARCPLVHLHARSSAGLLPKLPEDLQAPPERPEQSWSSCSLSGSRRVRARRPHQTARNNPGAATAL
eukprot:4181590-Alexandrium_andersonii.AAC.1